MFLGIDLGTSGIKGLILDETQTAVASAHAGLTVERSHAGWSEQDPAQWITAMEAVLDQLHRDHGKQLSAVRGIGFSGQMHGATLLDAQDQVLRPCILWNDTRSAKQARALDEDEQFRRLTGNIVFPGFTAPKINWVTQNEPDIANAIRRVLLPKDYLRLWFTGEYVSEMSDASGTSWLDVEKRSWSSPLLEACGLTVDHMPTLVEGSQSSGTVRKTLADRYGMGNAVQVAGGAGDNAASAIGLGATTAGSAFVSLGTSGVLFAANDQFLPNAESAVHAFCHALPETWHQMGVFLSATDSLNWWANRCGSTAEELTAEVGDSDLTPSPITFLPYLSGERTPHNDADIRGALIGLDHSHTNADITQAVMESVAFALCDNRAALESAGTRLDRVMAVGGGTRSEAWLQMIANALGVPVDLPADGDFGAAFGAARLGMLCVEQGTTDAICTAPNIRRSFEPMAQQAYGDAYQRYRALYPAIKSVL